MPKLAPSETMPDFEKVDRERDMLFVSELAFCLRRKPGFVYGMRRRGFLMPNNQATYNQAIEFLRKEEEQKRQKKLAKQK